MIQPKDESTSSTMALASKHRRRTFTVEASSRKPLRVYRVLDISKASQPFLKGHHVDTSTFRLPDSVLLLLLSRSLQRYVANVVPQDEKAGGEMFVVFSPGRVPDVPVGQYAPAAETLNLVVLTQVVEARLGQISRSHWYYQGPRGEGLKTAFFTLHMRDHRINGLIDHLSCSQAILHILRFFIVSGIVSQ